jgi:hypothetical protein
MHTVSQNTLSTGQAGVVLPVLDKAWMTPTPSEQEPSGSGFYLSCQNNNFLFVSGSAGQLAFGLGCG